MLVKYKIFKRHFSKTLTQHYKIKTNINMFLYFSKVQLEQNSSNNCNFVKWTMTFFIIGAQFDCLVKYFIFIRSEH